MREGKGNTVGFDLLEWSTTRHVVTHAAPASRNAPGLEPLNRFHRLLVCHAQRVRESRVMPCQLHTAVVKIMHTHTRLEISE